MLALLNNPLGSNVKVNIDVTYLSLWSFYFCLIKAKGSKICKKIFYSTTSLFMKNSNESLTFRYLEHRACFVTPNVLLIFIVVCKIETVFDMYFKCRFEIMQTLMKKYIEIMQVLTKHTGPLNNVQEVLVFHYLRVSLAFL